MNFLSVMVTYKSFLLKSTNVFALTCDYMQLKMKTAVIKRPCKESKTRTF